jgi:hypothetical protein
MSYRQYPISVFNKKCITPCYSKSAKYFNPINARYYDASQDKHNTKGSCAVIPHMDESNMPIYFERCNAPNDTVNQLDLISIHGFLSDLELLVDVYGINNIQEAFDWVSENLTSSKHTIDRVLNIVWRNYSGEIITNNIIKFYNDLLLTKGHALDIIDVKNRIITILDSKEFKNSDKPHKFILNKLIE